jgi:hypothetical protein
MSVLCIVFCFISLVLGQNAQIRGIVHADSNGDGIIDQVLGTGIPNVLVELYTSANVKILGKESQTVENSGVYVIPQVTQGNYILKIALDNPINIAALAGFGLPNPTITTNPAGGASIVGQNVEWLFTVTATGGVVHPLAVGFVPVNSPPDCSTATISVSSSLGWKHLRMNGVTDVDEDTINVVVESVFQDEPVENGFLSTCPDAKTDTSGVAKLRYEALLLTLLGNGRVYHVTFKASDPSGAFCTKTVRYCIPTLVSAVAGLILPDIVSPCIDGGAIYDSMQDCF